MQQNLISSSNKQLDSYSVLISSKYFRTEQDFINLICVNSKFKETTEKLRFNPIPIKSTKLFPKIQTQYLYDKNDTKMEGIDNYEIWYTINYDEYLKYKENNIIFHNIIYTEDNMEQYGKEIPNVVTILGDKCFNNCKSLTSITLPSSLTSLEITLPSKILFVFLNCESLTSINLPSTLQTLGNWFMNCPNLKLINLPSILSSISIDFFINRSKLTYIDIPTTITSLDDNCFSICESLQSIILPSSIKSLGIGCFSGCKSLKSIELPSTIKCISSSCFDRCTSLTAITIPSTIINFGNYCFYGCDQLIGKIQVPNTCFGES
ncbi:hypothetical protein QTN25_008077 [Entamoeba marina]